MMDPKTNPGSEEHESIERYDLEVAPRVRNLPAYLFGRINELKYRKRRDGIDVIDLGMGNPTDPPRSGSSTSSARPPATRGITATAWPTGVYNLRREVAVRYERRFGVSLDPDHEVVATIGSKEGFSHMCLALLGPGDTALVPAPSFPIHIHAIALASANVISLDVRDSQAFLTNIARVCESLLPQAQDPGPQLSPQPDGHGRRSGLLRGDRRAGQEVPLLRDPRLRLWRHRLRRLSARRASSR